MPKYIIYFNQQWVGDHSSEWFQSRGPLARQVVTDLEAAGALVFAGGLVEEIELAIGADENGTLTGPVTKDGEFVGGLTIIDVASDEEANIWGAKIAVACGWPQEIRRFKGN
jgi:hypothetical protein